MVLDLVSNGALEPEAQAQRPHGAQRPAGTKALSAWLALWKQTLPQDPKRFFENSFHFCGEPPLEGGKGGVDPKP